MRRAIMVGLVLALFGAGLARAEEATGSVAPDLFTESKAKGKHGQEMLDALIKMRNDLAAAPMIGDTDRDFAVRLLAHHQAMLSFLDVEIKHGKSPRLRAVAKDLARVYRIQARSLEAWLRSDDARVKAAPKRPAQEEGTKPSSPPE